MVFCMTSEKRDVLLPWLFTVLLVLTIGCLCVGFLTRWLAGLFSVAAVVALATIPAVHAESAVVASAVAASVALLGPGGYSVDSLWYGRVRRIFPP